MNTNLYRVVHEQAPRGRRSWGFAIGQGLGIIWITDASYDAALEHALRKAREMGAASISVLP